ncbi:MAG TPA: hypothetical protein VK518_12535, partial [Puia sp.]|nr:hypothetical protein [Puia sp.]
MFKKTPFTAFRENTKYPLQDENMGALIFNSSRQFIHLRRDIVEIIPIAAAVTNNYFIIVQDEVRLRGTKTIQKHGINTVPGDR